MEEMAKQKLYPTSLRLVDNLQFGFGQALKPAETDKWKILKAKLAKQYIAKIKGFKADAVVAATCLFEGPKDIVNL